MQIALDDVRSSWPQVAPRSLGCGNLSGYTSRDCYLPQKRSSLVADDCCIVLAFFDSSMGLGGASVAKGMLPG